MFSTEGSILTNEGINLINRSLAETKSITFTTVKIGVGDINNIDEARGLTSLKEEFKNIGLTSINRNNSGLIRVRSSFTNEFFQNGEIIKELGVFGNIEGEKEVLIAYVNDGIGELIPPGNTGNIVERVRDIYMGISESIDVLATIDKSIVYATIYDLEEELRKKSDLEHGHDLVSITQNGFMNSSNYVKLSKIEEYANKYELPISSSTVLGGVKVGNNLTIKDGILSGNSDYSHPNTPAMRHVTDIEKASWNGKEDNFIKNDAHNKSFGTSKGEVLEGKHINENLGSDYGGLIGSPGIKIMGKTYYCGANKSIFLCKVEKDIDYIDLRYFTDFSHKGLLGKLENLFTVCTKLNTSPISAMNTIPILTNVNISKYRTIIFVVDWYTTFGGEINRTLEYTFPTAYLINFGARLSILYGAEGQNFEAINITVENGFLKVAGFHTFGNTTNSIKAIYGI